MQGWAVFGFVFAGVNAALLYMSSVESDREQKFIDYSQKAAHARDAYYDACESEAGSICVERLLAEMKALEKKRDEYW
jgi:hypothetical protein